MNLKSGIKKTLDLGKGEKKPGDPLQEIADGLTDMAMNADIQTDLLAKMALKQGAITEDEFKDIMEKDET